MLISYRYTVNSFLIREFRRVNVRCSSLGLFDFFFIFPFFLTQTDAFSFFSWPLIVTHFLLIKTKTMASITTKQEEQHVTDSSYKESSSDVIVFLCSKCNKPAQPNRTLRKCKCKGVQYCNNTCYRAHWKEHKAEHNRLVVKLLPSTGETKEDSATKVKEVATKDKPTIQKKKWIDNIEDNCPICLDDLLLDQTDTSRMTCCGKGMHLKCADQFDNSTSMSYEQKARCVMCRAQLPNSVNESIKQIRKWATKGKAWAQTMMGGRYEEGDGVRKSNCKAAEFYKLSAAQNDANGMENFARMSYHVGFNLLLDPNTQLLLNTYTNFLFSYSIIFYYLHLLYCNLLYRLG